MLSRSDGLHRIVLAFILLIVAAAALPGEDGGIRAVGGVIDLRGLDLDKHGPIELNGEWAFYWDTVVDSETGGLPEGAEPDHYVEVPSYWDDLQDLDERITPRGTATYVLDILMPETNTPIALRFLNVTPNAEIHVDGVHRAEMGKVARNEHFSRSGNQVMLIPITCHGPRVTVSVGISNYHNVNGGLNRPVEIGHFQQIRLAREKRLAHDAIFLGGLFLMGLYQLALFLLNRKNIAPLFMAILCFLAFFFAGMKNEMALLALFPGWDGEVRTKFIYLALALAPAAFTWYAVGLYPVHMNRWINHGIGILANIFSLFILLTPKAVFTRILLPLELVVGFAAGYNFFMLIRGYIRSRDRQILLYLGGLVYLILCIFAGMMDNAASTVFESLPAIFFTFILYQAFLQAYIFSNSFREIDTLTNQKIKLEKRNVELFSLSYIDSLTGTCNRRLFDDYLASNWRVSALSGKSLGMILLDIDHFKDYNEFYGHRQGDVCLNRVCELVRDEMTRQGQDTLARYGGEEFAIIVSDTGTSELFELAEALRNAVEQGKIEHRTSSVALMVTISLGCAVLTPSMEEAPETLIDAADSALNQAKAEGRNRTVIRGGKAWEPKLV